MPKILLVEDSEEFQKVVARTLGHLELICAATVADALRALRESGPFDLILLDIGLPGSDGYTLLSELQDDATSAGTPILCLTGRTAVTDKVTAFRLGADDYILKPFDPIEFKARIDGKLAKRKRQDVGGDTLGVAPLELNLSTHRVWIDEPTGRREVEVTQTEFKILAALLRAPDRAFTRDQLLVQAWGEDARVLDRAVDVHVCSLRKKLGAQGANLKAVAGVGYKYLPSAKKAA